MAERIDFELLRTLRAAKYTTTTGIEVLQDYWKVDAVGTAEALAAHPVLGKMLLPDRKMRCRKTGIRNSRKRDGRVRIQADADVFARLDDRFQKFMAPFHAMAEMADESR